MTDFRRDDRRTTTVDAARKSATTGWSRVTAIVARSEGRRRGMTFERADDPVVTSVVDLGKAPAGDAVLLESAFGLPADAGGV